MGTRGPTAASLAVIGPSGIETVRRPDPPSELTDEQAIEWRAIVNRMAADWFPRETHSLLVQMCRLIIRSRRMAQIAEALENAEPFDAKAYRETVKSEEAISRAIASLATKLRITLQSTWTKDRQKPKMLPRAPWGGDDDDD